jgi:hypothetical protein
MTEFQTQLAQSFALAAAARQQAADMRALSRGTRQRITETRAVIAEADRQLRAGPASQPNRSVAALVAQLLALTQELEQAEARQLDDLAATRAQIAEIQALLAECGASEQPGTRTFVWLPAPRL